MAVAAFRVWAGKEYGTIEKVNARWGTSFSRLEEIKPAGDEQSWNHNRELDWRTFWESFQTEQLRWLADQVRAVDSTHPLHLNPAGITGNLADVSDNLPAWRGFLDTLGCSIHPAWHFGLFDRDRYALAVSYTNDLVRGSIEPKPYWVTELQGGNNIYSGTVPMEPTGDDIAQWTWTSVASGANRVIYWLLNARREGVEAGEWSLLDFAQQPSERLKTASRIAKVIDDNSAFRHKDLQGADEGQDDPLEAEARRRRLTYVRLDGWIGVIGNGAGLVMNTLDLVAREGGRAANFLDIGGGAKAEVVHNALELLAMDQRVSGILINIFGGITRGDEVARGIIEAQRDLRLRVPLVVRMTGTREEEGRRMLAEAGIAPEASPTAAARKIVELAGQSR